MVSTSAKGREERWHLNVLATPPGLPEWTSANADLTLVQTHRLIGSAMLPQSIRISCLWCLSVVIDREFLHVND
jgi:hypothetical protein